MSRSRVTTTKIRQNGSAREALSCDRVAHKADYHGKSHDSTWYTAVHRIVHQVINFGELCMVHI